MQVLEASRKEIRKFERKRVLLNTLANLVWLSVPTLQVNWMATWMALLPINAYYVL